MWRSVRMGTAALVEINGNLRLPARVQARHTGGLVLRFVGPPFGPWRELRRALRRANETGLWVLL